MYDVPFAEWENRFFKMSSVVDSGDYEVVDHDDPSMKSAGK